MRNIEAHEILEALWKANSYFHLHFDGDSAAKKSFYKSKDTVVIEVVNGRYPGIECVLKEIQQDGDHTYALFTFYANRTSIKVHLPIEKIPNGSVYADKVARDDEGAVVHTAYLKDMGKYAETYVDEEEYARCRKLLDELASEAFGEKVDAIDDDKLLNTIHSTSGKFGLKPLMSQAGWVTFYTRKSLKPVYSCRMRNLRKTIKTTGSFNYKDVYKYLKKHGMVHTETQALPHPDW